MNKRLCIIIILFVISLYTVSGGSLLNFTETFSTFNGLESSVCSASGAGFITRNTGTGNSFQGDILTWYCGIVNGGGTAFGLGNDLNSTNRWNPNLLKIGLQPSTFQTPIFWVDFAGDDFSFNNETVISFYINSSAKTDITHYVRYGIGLQNNGECLAVNQDQNTNLNAVYCAGSSDNQVIDSRDGGDFLEPFTPQFYSVNFSEITTNETYRTIDRIIFNFDIGNADTADHESIQITNITIINIFNGTNDLPDFNITLNNSILCINETGDKATFNFSIETFDAEGDTIYYSIEALSEIARNITIDYNIENCFLSICSDSRKAEFLDRIVSIPNTCSIIDSDVYDSNSHNFVLEPDSTSNSRYMLEHNGFCNQTDKSIWQKLSKPFTDLTYIAEIYDFNINESIGIEFYDSTQTQKILEVSMNKSDLFSTFRVQDETTLSLFDVSETGVNDDSFIIELRLDRSDNSFDIVLKNLTSKLSTTFFNYSLYTTNENVLNVRLRPLELNGINSTFLLSNYKYNGFFGSPVFSTDKPTGVSFFQFGRKVTDIYISDEFNQPTRFKKGTLNLNVLQCSEYVLPLDQTGDLAPSLAPLKSSLRNVCSSLDNVFSIGYLDFSRYGFCFLMTVAWFFITAIVSIGFTFIMTIFKKGIGFATFFFLWSLFGVFGNLILVYSFSFQLVLGITMAISGMMFFRTLFLTGEFTSE